MNGLERIVAMALQHKEADRVAAGPWSAALPAGYMACTYAEWAQDGELAAKCMVQAQELIRPRRRADPGGPVGGSRRFRPGNGFSD